MFIRKQIDSLLRKFEKDFVTHNRIEVSKGAILHNLDLFALISGKQVIPVLKGNAYGHGINLVAKALKGRALPYIAVDGYFEALRIREVSDQPVLIMGAILSENYTHMRYDNFAFVVQDTAAINGLGKTGKKIKVHLECNTGMNRYGALPSEVAALTKFILSYKNLTLEGVMSHLADGDGENEATIQAAVDQFDACVDAIRQAGGKPSIIHISQSAGSLKAISRHATAIRLGIGLYGLNPFPRKHVLHKELVELRPALRLVSTITQTIDLKKGDKVSYNYTFTAPHAMRIGILPLGYYEGVNRSLSNAGVVKIGDTYTPIVGRVCMNHTMISLEGIDARVGDEVIVYSNNLNDKNSLDMIADDHQLFNYNLLTALSYDVRRKLID